jgi:phage tail protein X
MQSRHRRWAKACHVASATLLAVGLATAVTSPNAAADIISTGIKVVNARLILRADRFDDYCEHRHTIAKGDTFEAIAKGMYGDAARAKDIAEANPTFDATRLPIGMQLLLPPKLAPPKDAKETLAWTFWSPSSCLEECTARRIYPDELLGSNELCGSLFAVPADRVAEFEKLLESAKPKDRKDGMPRFEDFVARIPWAIPANVLVCEPFVKVDSPADESVTTFRIAELAAGPNPPGRFVVTRESVEYRDKRGHVVKAGFDFLFTRRGIPLGLIALLGILGLRRLRRSRGAAALLGTVLALVVAAPTASADILEPGTKRVEVRLVLRADRFDDYCEHRHKIAKGDTFEAIARKAYGDAARSKEIAAANPTLEATRLPIGTDVILPPKLAPPKDAKETLAWTFWGHASRSDEFALQRLYPDETFGLGEIYSGLFAMPVDRNAEFEKLLADAKPKDSKSDGAWAHELMKRTPWALPVDGLRFERVVNENSPADVSVTSFRITELAAGPDPSARFVVRVDSVEYRDRRGNVVKAGFDLLLSWRGFPLGLIALIGTMGIRRMRRTCAARS